MRTRLSRGLAGLFLLALPGLSQQWEMNGVVGVGAYRNLTLSNAYGRATTGFTTGALFGVSLLQHRYEHVSGEIRYVFQRSDLKVASGGTTAKFRGSTHALHYDWLIHTRPRRAWARPFVAFGSGFKSFSGTGTEQAYQPLSQFALLTRTQEWKPLVTLGAGVRFRLAAWASLAAEFRDYLTPFPRNVIAPVGGATLDRWLHDLTTSLALGIRF